MGAFTSAPREHLVIRGSPCWIESPHSDQRARRGFCRRCGSCLFWQPDGSEHVHIAAGTLDRPTGLRIAGHWYPEHAGDYDELPDDGLPRGPDALRDIRRG